MGPWVFCEFLVRMVPDQLAFIEKDFFALLNKNNKTRVYNKIFTCTVCSVSRKSCRLHGIGEFVLCDECSKDSRQNLTRDVLDNTIFKFQQDEGLEKIQLIFTCLLMHPTLCAVHI